MAHYQSARRAAARRGARASTWNARGNTWFLSIHASRVLEENGRVNRRSCVKLAAVAFSFRHAWPARRLEVGAYIVVL